MPKTTTCKEIKEAMLKNDQQELQGLIDQISLENLRSERDDLLELLQAAQGVNVSVETRNVLKKGLLKHKDVVYTSDDFTNHLFTTVLEHHFFELLKEKNYTQAKLFVPYLDFTRTVEFNKNHMQKIKEIIFPRLESENDERRNERVDNFAYEVYSGKEWSAEEIRVCRESFKYLLFALSRMYMDDDIFMPLDTKKTRRQELKVKIFNLLDFFLKQENIDQIKPVIQEVIKILITKSKSPYNLVGSNEHGLSLIFEYAKVNFEFFKKFSGEILKLMTGNLPFMCFSTAEQHLERTPAEEFSDFVLPRLTKDKKKEVLLKMISGKRHLSQEQWTGLLDSAKGDIVTLLRCFVGAVRGDHHDSENKDELSFLINELKKMIEDFFRRPTCQLQYDDWSDLIKANCWGEEEAVVQYFLNEWNNMIHTVSEGYFKQLFPASGATDECAREYCKAIDECAMEYCEAIRRGNAKKAEILFNFLVRNNKIEAIIPILPNILRYKRDIVNGDGYWERDSADIKKIRANVVRSLFPVLLSTGEIPVSTGDQRGLAEIRDWCASPKGREILKEELLKEEEKEPYNTDINAHIKLLEKAIDERKPLGQAFRRSKKIVGEIKQKIDELKNKRLNQSLGHLKGFETLKDNQRNLLIIIQDQYPVLFSALSNESLALPAVLPYAKQTPMECKESLNALSITLSPRIVVYERDTEGGWELLGDDSVSSSEESTCAYTVCPSDDADALLPMAAKNVPSVPSDVVQYVPSPPVLVLGDTALSLFDEKIRKIDGEIKKLEETLVVIKEPSEQASRGSNKIVDGIKQRIDKLKNRRLNQSLGHLHLKGFETLKDIQRNLLIIIQDQYPVLFSALSNESLALPAVLPYAKQTPMKCKESLNALSITMSPLIVDDYTRIVDDYTIIVPQSLSQSLSELRKLNEDIAAVIAREDVPSVPLDVVQYVSSSTLSALGALPSYVPLSSGATTAAEDAAPVPLEEEIAPDSDEPKYDPNAAPISPPEGYIREEGILVSVEKDTIPSAPPEAPFVDTQAADHQVSGQPAVQSVEDVETSRLFGSQIQFFPPPVSNMYPSTSHLAFLERPIVGGSLVEVSPTATGEQMDGLVSSPDTSISAPTSDDEESDASSAEDAVADLELPPTEERALVLA